MDEYIKDVIDSKKYLVLEKAVDEDLQAEQDLTVEVNTVAGKFVDSFITDEDMDCCPFGEEETNTEIDELIADAEEDPLLVCEPDTFSDDDGELSEINAVLDSDIDPEILELDVDDDLYFED